MKTHIFNEQRINIKLYLTDKWNYFVVRCEIYDSVFVDWLYFSSFAKVCELLSSRGVSRPSVYIYDLFFCSEPGMSNELKLGLKHILDGLNWHIWFCLFITF